MVRVCLSRHKPTACPPVRCLSLRPLSRSPSVVVPRRADMAAYNDVYYIPAHARRLRSFVSNGILVLACVVSLGAMAILQV